MTETCSKYTALLESLRFRKYVGWEQEKRFLESLPKLPDRPVFLQYSGFANEEDQKNGEETLIVTHVVDELGCSWLRVDKPDEEPDMEDTNFQNYDEFLEQNKFVTLN